MLWGQMKEHPGQSSPQHLVQALKIKATLPMLCETMASLGAKTYSVFETWLEKEKTYLNSLTKEPVQETLQIEYYQKLVNVPPQQDTNQWAAFCRGSPWTWSSGVECMTTPLMVTNRHYQHTLDELKDLIVTQMFELSKALQAQSKGVSLAGSKLSTRSLADFDLLREGRKDIRNEERFFVYHDGRLQAEGKQALAYQLSKEEGFTASLSPGVSISKECLIPEAVLGDSEDVEMQERSRCAMSIRPRLDEEEGDNSEQAETGSLN
ncbi:hypothetical protein DFH08DRAFT_798842 [Mycena albidolilacea]|uniref:Uncharacterized protein n=1 Tax=Mycena albidolilacea TaxID=1033008 RepID=A0AAD7F2B1_9AGAR|nr:hypothetical protein DFH08DRAFT_798842 [Mycena albidolilacea]